MIYFQPTTTGIDRLPKNKWGVIRTPSSYNIHKYGYWWICDNEAFTNKFTWGRLVSFLDSMNKWRNLCKFVVCPDEVSNACATLDKFRWYAWRIKALGWPVAFVAQDGQELMHWPPEYDALFIGGTTEWKESDAADWCIGKAKSAGKWVHVGRVNSNRRIRHFQLVGVDSVDGTSPAIAPDQAHKRFNRQLLQKPLFTLEK